MPEHANPAGETSAKGDAAGKAFSVEDLAQRVGGRVEPAPEPATESGSVPVQETAKATLIRGIASLDSAAATQLSHLSSPAFAAALATTNAGAVLLREADVHRCPCIAIVVDNPYWAYAHLSALFEHPQQISGLDVPNRQAHTSSVESLLVAEGATVGADVQCGTGVRIAAGASVGAQSRLGDAVVIHANAVIGARVTLGQGVTIHPGAIIADDVRIGANSTIHANAVVGGEGFGYAPSSAGVLERIAQLGSVEIGQNVSIGAGSTVDRGALGDTWIGDGVKIDNQVQIGHNCRIGNHSVICGCCGIVGSTTIGKHCVLGGGVGVGGDGPITLCDGVTVSGMTHVSRSIDAPGVYSGGVLHSESSRWKRNALRFADLDGLAKRLTRLEKRQSDDNAPT